MNATCWVPEVDEVDEYNKKKGDDFHTGNAFQAVSLSSIEI